MAHDRLTDKAIRAAKPKPFKIVDGIPKDQPYKLTDGRAMSLVVHSSGARVWRLKYRLQGIEKSFSLGSYPDTSLALARRKRDEARAKIAEAIDPVQAKRQAKAAANEGRRHTFEIAAEAYFKKNSAAWSETHQRDVKRIIYKALLPTLGRKRMSTISSADAQAVITEITDREAYTFAKDVRTYGRCIWKEYNKGRKMKLADPFDDVDVAKGPAAVSHPALPRAEIGDFLRRVRNSPNAPMVRLGVVLLLHTAMRSGELRGLRWGDVNLSERLVTIPAARMKNGFDFLVPLSTQSVDLFGQLRSIGAELRRVHPTELKADDLIFPHAFDMAQCISENTLIHCVWRAGFKGRMTPHGCRAVFSTWANEVANFNPDAIEAQLAHVTGDAVRRAYNRAKYIEEGTRMMQTWADWLTEQERTAEVIPLRAAAGVS